MKYLLFLLLPLTTLCQNKRPQSFESIEQNWIDRNQKKIKEYYICYIDSNQTYQRYFTATRKDDTVYITSSRYLDSIFINAKVIIISDKHFIFDNYYHVNK